MPFDPLVNIAAVNVLLLLLLLLVDVFVVVVVVDSLTANICSNTE